MLYPLHFVIQQLSNMKLSYLLLERKIGFNLLDDEYVSIHYVTDTIKNSPIGHQLTTQVKKNVWIIAINWEDPITSQGEIDELNIHQTPRGKSKAKINLCRRKRYQSTDIEEISSLFDQVRLVVSHLEVHPPENALTQNKFVKALKGSWRKLLK